MSKMELKMSRSFKKQKFCKFTKEGISEIDYKDLNTFKRVYFRNRKNIAK